MKHALIACILPILFGCTGINKTVTYEKTISGTTADVISGAVMEQEKLERIYYFVRDEIEFNWVYPQDIPPEDVLNNGIGVCMQKANLFAAMAREAGFETRFHFVYVGKNALKDFLPGFAFEKWADPFPHTVAEVLVDGEWISFDTSFDRELLDICMEKGLNFGGFPGIVGALSTEFSPRGVKGPQEYFADETREGFYGSDLTPLMEFERTNVSRFKRSLKPVIFRKAREIMNEIRGRS